MKNHTIRILAAGMHLLLLTSVLIFVLSSCDEDEPEQGPPLSIESISPTTARAGETITITGTGFHEKPSRNDIVFSGRASGAVDGQVLEASTTSLKVKVPGDAEEGPIKVTVQSVSVITTQNFILDTSLGAPTVASISPDNGFINTEVTITGTKFGTDKNLMKVLFGTTEVTDILAMTATTVKVKVPVSLPAGDVDVKVEREGLPSTSSVRFNVKPAPTIVTSLYYSTSDDIVRTVIDNKGVRTDLLQEIELGAITSIATDIEGGYVYWGSYGVIMRAPLTGGPAETVYADGNLLFLVGDLAIDHATGTLYFSAVNDTFEQVYILKGSIDGAVSLEILHDDVMDNFAGNLKFSQSANTLYWAEFTSQRIRSASLSGNFTPVTLFDKDDNMKFPVGIALDEGAGKLYITDNGNGNENSILTGNLDGTGTLATLVPHGDHLKFPNDAEIDTVNGYFYWVNTWINDSGAANITRVKLDGTGIEVFVEGFSTGQVLAIDTR